jgi:hypothetical protein
MKQPPKNLKKYFKNTKITIYINFSYISAISDIYNKQYPNRINDTAEKCFKLTSEIYTKDISLLAPKSTISIVKSDYDAVSAEIDKEKIDDYDKEKNKMDNKYIENIETDIVFYICEFMINAHEIYEKFFI